MEQYWQIAFRPNGLFRYLTALFRLTFADVVPAKGQSSCPGGYLGTATAARATKGVRATSRPGHDRSPLGALLSADFSWFTRHPCR